MADGRCHHKQRANKAVIVEVLNSDHLGQRVGGGAQGLPGSRPRDVFVQILVGPYKS